MRKIMGTRRSGKSEMEGPKYCETCEFFSEGSLICVCERGMGRAVYWYPACEEYKEKRDA